MIELPFLPHEHIVPVLQHGGEGEMHFVANIHVLHLEVMDNEFSVPSEELESVHALREN